MPNPTLNERIAKAKGWTKDHRQDFWVYPNPKSCYSSKTSRRYTSLVWSTDISAAWELVEEMGEAFVGILSYSSGWIAKVRDADGETYCNPLCPPAVSDCQAICHAYLAWKEQKL